MSNAAEVRVEDAATREPDPRHAVPFHGAAAATPSLGTASKSFEPARSMPADRAGDSAKDRRQGDAHGKHRLFAGEHVRERASATTRSRLPIRAPCRKGGPL